MHFGRGVFTILALVFSVGLILPGCGSSSGESCSDECTQGELRCASSQNGYEVCGNYDDDSCQEWGGLVACDDNTTCSNGVCDSVQTGMVLTGELLPTGGVSTADGLQLNGALTRGPGGTPSQSGSLTLDHIGFTSR